MSVRTLSGAALLLLCGCSTTHVVLLPGPDGKVGQIAVLGDGKETVIKTAYSEANVGSFGTVATTTLEEKAARDPFSQTLDALPQRPVSYMLFFKHDSDELTQESSQQATAILGEIAKRPAAEVVVIGHTDKVGSDEYNDQLSMARAAAVRTQLLALGFKARQVSIAGRGSREPLVETGRSEPRNRRAEISVR